MFRYAGILACLMVTFGAGYMRCCLDIDDGLSKQVGIAVPQAQHPKLLACDGNGAPIWIDLYCDYNVTDKDPDERHFNITGPSSGCANLPSCTTCTFITTVK